ncbi:kinase-like protein [Stipitochalara longipes BDJ]|nr:kinase-like protein [Stipitochalara longipes BDJ]
MAGPDIFIDRLKYRGSTFSLPPAGDDFPRIAENDSTPLDQLLRQWKIEDPKPGFWSWERLLYILSRNRIQIELRKYTQLENAESYVEHIRPDDEADSESLEAKTYLRIFALLVLTKKGDQIGNFIKEEVSDKKLPICRHQGSRRGEHILCFKKDPHQPLKVFEEWYPHERAWFEQTQWETLVPYFDLDPSNRARHYNLDDSAILPWRNEKLRSLISPASRQSSWSSVHEGGFADVSCIRIDSSSHGFSEVLKDVIRLNDSRFALKKLHGKDYNDEAKFRKESEQLQRFSGLVNNHLVTLLATLKYQNRFYFLFPYAEFDLDAYWESKERNPKMDNTTVRWVAKQCSGIMAGIDAIHEPQSVSLHGLVEKKYGRHGDIKPGNILWFDTSSDPRGILVISDMWLSALNRETSRSVLARYNIHRVPGYSPAECDVKGAKISRAYDIWTLCCLFLELLTWLLGGSDLRNQFEEKRTTIYITGSKNNIFFVLKKYHQQPDVLVAQVKDEVSQWIHDMHNDKRCSQFIHDALDIIETDMLVVLSQERKRSESGPLKKKFGDLLSKCMDDNDLEYCTKGAPQRRLLR